MFEAASKLADRQDAERSALLKIKDKTLRATKSMALMTKHNNQNKLFTDLGAFAAIKGYQAIKAPGEFVVLDRGAIVFIGEK